MWLLSDLESKRCLGGLRIDIAANLRHDLEPDLGGQDGEMALHVEAAPDHEDHDNGVAVVWPKQVARRWGPWSRGEAENALRLSAGWCVGCAGDEINRADWPVGFCRCKRVGAFVEEALDVRGGAQEDGNMEWGEVVCVGDPLAHLLAFVDKSLCVHVVLSAALEVGTVHLEKLDGGEVAAAGGEEGGAVALVVRLVDVDAARQERLDDLGVATVGGRDEWGEARLVALREAAAVVENPLDKRVVAAVAGEQEGRIAVVGAVVEGAALGDEPLDEVMVSAACGKDDGRVAAAVLEVKRGAHFDEELDHFAVAAVAGR
eukprot:m.290253 g.290253  ORF g.290253 m.290253 type:complete len:317 (+) comp12258_c0_seq1:511-1461(+)